MTTPFASVRFTIHSSNFRERGEKLIGCHRWRVT